MSDTTKSKKHGWLIGVAVLGGLLLLGQAGTGNSGNSTTTATSGSQLEKARSWGAAVLPELQTASTSMTNVQLGCSDGNVYSCLNSAKAVSVDVKHALRVMDNNPAPSCLSNTESGMKTAIRTIDQSVDMSIDAMSTNNISEMRSAISKMETVTPMFRSLTASFPSELATCG